MAWGALGTTMAMVGFLGVVGSAGYVLQPTDNAVRVERMCKPIRTISDYSYKYIERVNPSVYESTSLFPRGVEYAHTDICVGKVASYFFGNESAEKYRHKDAFFSSLKSDPRMGPADIELIVSTGGKYAVDWSNERETSLLLREYLEYKSLNQGAME